MKILAIDPGTTESGFVLFDDGMIIESGTRSNDELAARMVLAKSLAADALAIEMIASYGMPVGKEVFDTCVWIGRFSQIWEITHPSSEVRLVYRKDVKLHLCGSARAKDSNIRQRLIDIFGPIGKKATPGALYGVKSHAWAALAVAVFAQQTGHVEMQQGRYAA